MKDKIEQLCDQIMDLLKKNDKEYIIAIPPLETYSTARFTIPEYFNSVISDYCLDELLYDSDEVERDDFVLYEEGDETTEFLLIAIRIESDKLVFCVEKAFHDDDGDACENLEEVSIGSLVDSYRDEAVERALEAYVVMLSNDQYYMPWHEPYY
jgi:hypothetical protein